MSLAFLADHRPLVDHEIDYIRTLLSRFDTRRIILRPWGEDLVLSLLATIERKDEILESQEALLDARREEIAELKRRASGGLSVRLTHETE